MLSASIVKAVTGGDNIKARKAYGTGSLSAIMTWVPIFLCNHAPKFDEWADADLGKKGGSGFALIRRVKFLTFPFTFADEEERAMIEATGETWRQKNGDLQNFMKTVGARNAMLLLLFRTFNDFRRGGSCCYADGNRIPIPRCCVATATEYHDQADKFSKMIPWLLARGIIEYTWVQGDWARGSLLVDEFNTYNYECGAARQGRRDNVQNIMLLLETSKSYTVANDTFPPATDPKWSGLRTKSTPNSRCLDSTGGTALERPRTKHRQVPTWRSIKST